MALYTIDLRCACGHEAEVSFKSYDDWKENGHACELCGLKMEKVWKGRAAGVVWKTTCHSASGGKGGCK